jgi:hypothetical protein
LSPKRSLPRMDVLSLFRATNRHGFPPKDVDALPAAEQGILKNQKLLATTEGGNVTVRALVGKKGDADSLRAATCKAMTFLRSTKVCKEPLPLSN